MNVTLPVQTPAPDRKKVSNALKSMDVGHMVEIEPFSASTQRNVFMSAKRIGIRVTTTKTNDGKLKVWRLK